MTIKPAKIRSGHSIERQNDDKFQRAINKLRRQGILPREGQEMSDEQKKIYSQTKTGELPEQPVILKLPLATTEILVWRKIKETATLQGQNFLLTVNDVVIPKTCPYLGIELSYDIKDRDKNNYFTIDRIDRSKMYDIDNTIIISKKAYIIRNLCITPQEFITLGQNILKIHSK